MLVSGDARAINYVLINGDYVLMNDDLIAHNVIALFSQIEQDCGPKQITRTAGVQRLLQSQTRQVCVASDCDKKIPAIRSYIFRYSANAITL